MDPQESTDRALRRITALDSTIRAFAYLDADQVRVAAVRQAARIPEGRLRGFTIGVKDIIDVEGMPTGLGWHVGQRPLLRKSAILVSRLVAAGAVVVGKTKTTPFAYADPADTCNPWNRDHTPGGSSSGSAAAVACGMVAGALGSQTAGSLIRPASFCGVVGLLPSPGLIPRSGVFPLSPTFDRIEFMARTVREVTAMFSTVVKSAGRAQSQSWEVDGTSLRFGRMPSLLEKATDSMRRATESACARLAEVGADVADLSDAARLSDVAEAHHVIMRSEAAHVHAGSKSTRYPPKLSALIEAGLATSACDYLEARQFKTEFGRSTASRMRHLDALILPAAVGPAPSGLGATGDPLMSVPTMLAGMPVLTIPWAFDESLPLGIQLVGKPGKDWELLALGAFVEELIPKEASVRAKRLADEPISSPLATLGGQPPALSLASSDH